MSTLSAPEKGPLFKNSVETGKLIVTQPAKLAELNDLLLTFESFSNKVSERTGEDRSGDLGGGGGATGQQGDDGSGVSPRDQAIANIPAPDVMQQKLHKHIEDEIKTLSAMAGKIAKTNRAGSAYRLNELYARIRRLNTLLADLLEASYEVIKRLFIRVFIDKQSIYTQ